MPSSVMYPMLALYDFIVESGGRFGYSTLASAIADSSTGDKFAIIGALSESADCEMKNDQLWHFFNCTMTFSAGYRLELHGNDTEVSGHVKATGSGTSADHNLIHITASRVNASGALLEAALTDFTSDSAYAIPILIGANSGCHINARVPATQFTITNNTWNNAALCIYQGTNNIVNFNCASFRNKGGVGPGNSYGIFVYDSDKNTIIANVQDVTTDTGNTGTGIYLDGTSDYNVVIGSSRGSDAANLTNLGTGNKTASVAT